MITVTIIICASTLTLFAMLGLFVSDRGPSHFDHWMELRQSRKLAEMNNRLELEKLKIQMSQVQLRMLEAPMPERSAPVIEKSATEIKK